MGGAVPQLLLIVLMTALLVPLCLFLHGAIPILPFSPFLPFVHAFCPPLSFSLSVLAPLSISLQLHRPSVLHGARPSQVRGSPLPRPPLLSCLLPFSHSSGLHLPLLLLRAPSSPPYLPRLAPHPSSCCPHPPSSWPHSLPEEVLSFPFPTYPFPSSRPALTRAATASSQPFPTGPSRPVPDHSRLDCQ